MFTIQLLMTWGILIHLLVSLLFILYPAIDIIQTQSVLIHPSLFHPLMCLLLMKDLIKLLSMILLLLFYIWGKLIIHSFYIIIFFIYRRFNALSKVNVPYNTSVSYDDIREKSRVMDRIWRQRINNGTIKGILYLSRR